MNIQNQLSSEEWNTLVEAPIKAGKAMIFASPSGPIGVVKETMVLLNSVKKATSTPSKSSFLGTVGKQLHDRLSSAKAIGDTLLTELQSVTAPEETREIAIKASKEASAILGKVPPTDALAYKEFIVSTASKVAEAASEEDITGMRGSKVSPTEQALLKDIKGALGVSP
ncbi:MAG TPA: hypothetical protein VGL94_00475 [Ktedonobacteraceae bacterium]|jgi:hypothetical protein